MKVFDVRLRFVYGPTQKPVDPGFRFRSMEQQLSSVILLEGQAESFEARRLVRGTYKMEAFWPELDRLHVGEMEIELSNNNVETTLSLALRDVTVEVVDRQGRPLSGATASIAEDVLREGDLTVAGALLTMIRVPDGVTLTFTFEWASPELGTRASETISDTAAGLAARRSVTLPVDDVVLKVVDLEGRAVAGARVTMNNVDVGTTDTEGVVVVEQVPLDQDYTVTVVKEDTTLADGARVTFTRGRTEATLEVGVYDLVVFVKGAAGQPIEGATVRLLRDGREVAASATDSSGKVVFPKVIAAAYEVQASVPGFSGSANVEKGQTSVTVQLDLFTTLFGVPMSLATFIALIIGIVLLIIVIAVIVTEYARWRGRRLARVEPTPPPKK